MNKFLISILLAAAAGVAGAAGPANTAADYGTPVASGPASQRITVGPDTRNVNVTDGEVVEFVVGGQSYLWHFQTFPNVNILTLDQIIPAAKGVKVYVARNPLYKNGY
ncbi:MAG TPA: CzcE family metal-binding protein [Pseudoduganella sp.]